MAHDISVEEALANIIAFLRRHFAEDPDKYRDVLDWLGDDQELWQLATPLGQVYDSDTTLDEARIVDGTTVCVVQSRQRENYRPVQDDVAEKIADYQRLNFGEWVSANARQLSGQLLPVLAAAMVAVVAITTTNGHLGLAGQLVWGAVLVLLGVAALLGASFGTPALVDASLLPLAAGVFVTGYVLLGGGGLLLVPSNGVGGWGMVAGVVLAGVGALTVNTVGKFPETLNYAVMSAAAVTAAAGVFGAVTGLGVIGTALGAVLVGLIMFRQAERLALMVAKIRPPIIPAQGEPFIRPGEDDLTSVEASEKHRLVTAMINQEEQSTTAHDSRVGIVWGALAVVAVAATVAGSAGEEHPWLLTMLIGALCVAMIGAGKAERDTLIQRGFHLAAATTAIGYTTTFALANDGQLTTLVLLCAATLLVGGVVAAYYSFKDEGLASPVTKKMIEVFELLCVFAIPVLVVLCLDGFAAFRAM